MRADAKTNARSGLSLKSGGEVVFLKQNTKTNKQINKKPHRPGRLHSINFRRKAGEVDFTFGFERGSVLSAAVRNVPDAKIAQNLVQVRGVDEHVLNGEGLHGALSVPTLASLLQPPVKSVTGAAFVTQTWRVVEEEGGGGGGGPSGGGVSKMEGKTEM